MKRKEKANAPSTMAKARKAGRTSARATNSKSTAVVQTDVDGVRQGAGSESGTHPANTRPRRGRPPKAPVQGADRYNFADNEEQSIAEQPGVRVYRPDERFGVMETLFLVGILLLAAVGLITIIVQVIARYQ